VRRNGPLDFVNFRALVFCRMDLGWWPTRAAANTQNVPASQQAGPPRVPPNATAGPAAMAEHPRTVCCYTIAMGFLYQFAKNFPWCSHQSWRAKVKPHGRPSAPAGLQPGISEGRGIPQVTLPEPLVTWSLDLDIGEVALGYHLITRSVSLFAKDLLFEYAFAPELTDEAHREVWLNMCYDADVSPANWDYIGAEGGVQYKRPPLEASRAWFDFFRPDYEWHEHFDHRSEPGSNYQRNRISRLTVDLVTGAAQIEK
jgi:hypothetical protein